MLYELPLLSEERQSVHCQPFQKTAVHDDQGHVRRRILLSDRLTLKTF